MSEGRVESERKIRNSFRTDSAWIPSDAGRRNPGRDGTGREGEEQQRSRERYHAALDWAKRALPEEHAPFAASAAMTIKALGGRVSAEAVRRRLVDQGRDAASLERLP